MLLLSFFSCQLVVGKVLGAAGFCRLFLCVFFLGLFLFFLCLCCVLWGQVVSCTLLSHHFGSSFSNIHLFYLLKKKMFEGKTIHFFVKCFKLMVVYEYSVVSPAAFNQEPEQSIFLHSVLKFICLPVDHQYSLFFNILYSD